MDLKEGNIEAAAEKLALVVSNAPGLLRVDALRVQGLLDMKQGRWREATAVLEEASALARSMPYTESVSAVGIGAIFCPPSQCSGASERRRRINTSRS
jgi:hypothetical protein